MPNITWYGGCACTSIILILMFNPIDFKRNEEFLEEQSYSVEDDP